MEDIIRRFCEYGMEYKDHQWYTHYWVTLLPEIQLPYNKSKHPRAGRLSSLIEKWWSPLLPVDHLKKNTLTIYPTTKGFHDMWKRECDTAARRTAEEKNNKQMYDKTHKEPEFREGDQV
ncbi:hypothetical protein O181_130297 [Austropuccinia psidii MF-1]|uniref:Uncharacterized protein n=1 Tax=Austropuccinia psidii MF-1 TaxID=1389203 RepID=A0A9Q3L3J5_9BASI|nr:hypothetical protein [Austropuccinia psidii MF-1]